MPVAFPDIQSLTRSAAQRKFRQPADDETEDQYREALATHVQQFDSVEAGEIRTGKPWDTWGPDERQTAIDRMTRAQIRELL
jgi:hypothetical protein